MTQIKSKKVPQLRQRRVFSEGVRRSIVQDIEQGKCTVSQAAKELAVSNNTIYQWIYRYSRYLIKNRIMVVEDSSEAYRSQELDKRIKDLEAALGRKQMEIDLLSKIIDLANQEYKTDLKKFIKAALEEFRLEKGISHKYKMNDIYSLVKISKQAMHKYKLRMRYVQNVSTIVVNECSRIRKNHKRMSCRKMYVRVKDHVPVGRDIFEQIGFANGFKLQIIRSKQRTTWATKLDVFENLLEGKTLNGMNQAFQSDIFYFSVEGESHYGITIIDVYSRKLLALHVSRTLRAEQNIIALKKAILEREGQSLEGCIFHSDRGGQYISEDQKELLRELKMIPSMCKLPQENAYSERVQGTIKHEYIYPENLTKKNLEKQIKRIQHYYNNERPHASLGNRTPNEYEEYINKLPLVERPEATVYKWTHPLLTITPVTNKKEKSSKKEKINNKSFKVKKVNLFQARSVYHLSSIIYHPNEIFF